MLKYSNILEYPEIKDDEIIIFVSGTDRCGWQQTYYKHIHSEYEQLMLSYSKLPWDYIRPDIHVCFDVVDTNGVSDIKKYLLWKTHLINDIIKEQGCVVFWINQKYNQMNIFDLAECKIRCEEQKCRMVVGINKKFVHDYFIQMIKMNENIYIPICHTLKDLAKETIKMCFNI